MIGLYGKAAAWWLNPKARCLEKTFKCGELPFSCPLVFLVLVCSMASSRLASSSQPDAVSMAGLAPGITAPRRVNNTTAQTTSSVNPAPQPANITAPTGTISAQANTTTPAGPGNPTSLPVTNTPTLATTAPIPSTPSTTQRPPNNSSVPPTQPHILQSLSGARNNILLNILSLGLFITVIVFVLATYSAESRSANNIPLNRLLRVNQSTTLAIVQGCQIVLVALATLTLGKAFEFIYWVTVGSRKGKGLRYLTLLALSPTTGYWGTIRLICAWPMLDVALETRCWGLLKVYLTTSIWASGIVLFANTSTVTVYDTGFSYNVTAGIGPFDGSLVQPFLDFLQTLAPPDWKNQTILPFTYLSVVNMLVINPLISVAADPVSCTDTGDGSCASYLVTGGLESVIPWIPPVEEYGGYDLARVDRVPSIQVDVRTIVSGMPEFVEEDCDVFGWGGVNIGAKLCVVADPSSQGSLRTGIFICTSGTHNETCHSKTPYNPNITALITFHTCQATIVASRSNYSIISIIDQTTPIPYLGFGILNTTSPKSTLKAYRGSLSWLLAPTSSIPPPSTLLELFSTASYQLSTPSTSSGILSQNFHGLLVFPFWMFNVNNWGNVETRQNITLTDLPGEFYTRANLVKGYEKIRFGKGGFVVFLVMQGGVMGFVWGVVVLGLLVLQGGIPGKRGRGRGRRRLLAEASEFPLYDVVFRMGVVGRDGRGGEGEEIMMRNMDQRGAVGTGEVIREMGGCRVIFRDEGD